MGLSDQVCNTGLALSLLVSHHDHKPAENSHFQQPDHQEKKRRKKDKFSLKYDHLFPSLTLGPSMVDACAGKASGDQSLSAVSSFSNSSEGEEAEVEKVSSRISNEDEEGSPRKKLRLTKQQSAILEDSFKEHSTLNPKQKQDLSRQLSLRPRQVEVWFQNRRARTKLKQTEVDCELLKKCCETLTEENKRLQKELQELKSLKLAAPFYMQLPAATLTICPSCERICNAGDGSSTSPFSIVAPKPHFYNPFNHPSAAC